MHPGRFLAWIFVLSLAALSTSKAASRAVIVTGLSGSSQNAEEFQRLAKETQRLLVERGIPAEQVELLTGKVTRDAILQKLKETAGAVTAADDFWLVLYGYCGQAQGGVPAFQISGPRLTADDLKAALDAIPGRQFVFIGAANSGGFLPILQSKQRSVLSATKEEGEGDLPRFPAQWLSAFGENPHAAFAYIAARAAALVEEEYTRLSLAQAEHARLADPVTGTILEPPFGVDLMAKEESPSVSPPPSSLLSASDIQVKINQPNAEWEQHPATAETKKIIEEARAVPNPEGYSALILEQRLSFTVEEDRTTNRSTYWRVYIARAEAVEEWANQFFEQAPPMVTTKLDLARVIQPDGSSTVFNPAKLAASTDPESSGDSMAMVFLPNAKAGCVIEVSYHTSEFLDATLPEVSENMPLLRSAPALKTSLEIRVPERPMHRVALHNVAAQAQESSENGRHVYRWQMDGLPAMESLPGDPPWMQWAAYATVSSLPSWDDFAKWYRRLAQGSDAIDPTVQKMAAQLAQGAKSRTEKMRRDFEFVSALRYVAIEIGVQGFRPRTPAQVLANRYGDCKDKANLLVALLRCQGIDANFVLLNRGSATDVHFPSWQFNHAIAYVGKAPEAGQAQDVWLDSTDGVTPFGYVPPGDFGRDGLVFSREKAEFKKVTGSSAATSEIHDEWDLTQDAGGGWQGSFHRQTSGTADDQLRRMFRGLTPGQRSVELYHLLAPLWPEGDFSKGTVSDVSAFGTGVELQAQASAAAGSLPVLSTNDLDYFSAPERHRALWLNDGQPLVLTQVLRAHYIGPAPQPAPPHEAVAAGEKLSIRWERTDGHTVTRTARLEIAQPVIAAADYTPVRGVIRDWNAALRN